MTKRELILEMANAIWRHVLAGVGRPPKAIVEAAGELAELYELANHAPVLDVAHRLRRAGAEDLGVCLMRLALGDAPDSYVDAAARADIAVPTFDLMAERHGDEIDVTWDGDAEPRGGLHQNPRGKRNTGDDDPVVFLLEDDPSLQKSTTRMIRKILPGAQVVVSDNVDGMIGNLRVLEPVLIVSDVDVIGDKSGIDFFHYVRDRYPKYVDRFVFFTGNLGAQDEHYRFVAKPADWKRLQEEILAPAPAGASSARTTASPPPAPPPRFSAAPTRGYPSVDEVAAMVKEVMPSIQTETDRDGRWGSRFGDEKVFVSAIWRRLKDDPRMGGMSLDHFKRMLVAANRARQLSLARADLVAAMNNEDVMTSEIADDIATFHFVIDRPASRQQAARAPHPHGRFASDVLAVLPGIRSQPGPSGKDMGRYGQRDVFIAAAWRRLRQLPGYQTLSLDEFKRHLLVANREQLLMLSRADLVDDMDPEEVELSEIDDGFGQFHFILDEPPRR